MRALVLLCCSVVTSALTVGTGLTGHDARLAPACGPACISTAQTAVRPRASTAQMGLMDWLTGLLYEDQLKASLNRRGSPDKAGSAALSRLKVVLAHDRTGLDEATMGKIRAEIQQVVAKYVYIETSDVQFDLVNDDKITLATATFPLRGARPENRLADVEVTVSAGATSPTEELSA